MATFEYKVKSGDTLQLGSSLSSVSMPGAVSVSGALTSAIDVKTYEKVSTTGTADAVDPDKYLSLVTSTGAHTVTLADGTYDGQVKKVILSVDGGTVTLTPANFSDGTSLTLADILDCVELIWDGSNWNIAQGAGLAIV